MILILGNIRSAHNVGALFRTADGAGVEKLYLVGITLQPAKRELYLTDAEKTLRKTALGAEKSLPWAYAKTLPSLLGRLKKEGYCIVALEQSDQSVDYRTLKLARGAKQALLVGNEVEGIGQKTLDLCDAVIELPMRGEKNSLNVAVAAGIALYHLSATMERLAVGVRSKKSGVRRKEKEVKNLGSESLPLNGKIITKPAEIRKT